MQTRRIAALVVVGLAGAGCSNAHRSTATPPRHVSRIAFEQNERIWIADRDGRHRRFLIHGESPEISPDGHWVAFYPCNACGLEVVDSDGGEARLLARNVNPPVWSPDSRQLATVGLTAGPNFAERLITVDRVTGRHHAIATAPNILGFDFSRDGKRLAFAISDTPDDLHSDVYVSAAAGGAVRRVTWDDRSSWPVWAADGSISFSHREGPLGPFGVDRIWGKHRIWQILPDGTGRTPLTRWLSPALLDERLGLRPVAWSDDGNTLLAVSPTHNGDLVYLVDRTGSIRSLGNHGDFGYASAILSRDGRFVLVWIQRDGPDSKRTRLVIAPATGGPPREIARDIGPPSWSR